MEITTDQAISNLIEAKSDSTMQKIAYAVAAKQLAAQKSQGDALVALISQAATAQSQIASGHLDVRV